MIIPINNIKPTHAPRIYPMNFTFTRPTNIKNKQFENNKAAVEKFAGKINKQIKPIGTSRYFKIGRYK